MQRIISGTDLEGYRVASTSSLVLFSISESTKSCCLTHHGSRRQTSRQAEGPLREHRTAVTNRTSHPYIARPSKNAATLHAQLSWPPSVFSGSKPLRTGHEGAGPRSAKTWPYKDTTAHHFAAWLPALRPLGFSHLIFSATPAEHLSALCTQIIPRSETFSLAKDLDSIVGN